MNKAKELKQVKIYLTNEHLAMCHEYGIKHNILANAGKYPGKPHVSKIIRIAIESLINSNDTPPG